MQHLKVDCDYCPPVHPKEPSRTVANDWEMHPSWIAGMEALNSYSDWVSSVVLPIAFQWIDEHRPEVYASVPAELRDDVGTVIAAAFKLIQELPAYKNGKDKRAVYEQNRAEGDTSRLNPAWTSVARKIRTATEGAFAEQETLSVNLSE